MTAPTLDDLEDRLGRSLTAEETGRAGALLDDVFEAVQLYTGQKFERADYTLRTRLHRGFVRLPQRPVHEVTAVTDLDGNDLEHTFDGIDRVYISSTCLGSWSVEGHSHPQVVDITYDAGPETLPPGIVGVVVGIVLRNLGRDPKDGAVIREAIDGYSYTIGTGGSGPYAVLDPEARVLDAYRRPLGVIRT